MLRRMPGRIVGETTDTEGSRAFVLTLQAREQHIRREKAASNICSNQAHCALRASVYMAAMGPDGMRQVAQLCYDKAHYLASGLSEAGFPLYNRGPFFNEFVTRSPVDTDKLMKKLANIDILGGLPVQDGILWCVTEMNTKAQMDTLLKAVQEI